MVSSCICFISETVLIALVTASCKSSHCNTHALRIRGFSEAEQKPRTASSFRLLYFKLCFGFGLSFLFFQRLFLFKISFLLWVQTSPSVILTHFLLLQDDKIKAAALSTHLLYFYYWFGHQVLGYSVIPHHPGHFMCFKVRYSPVMVVT